MNDLDRYWEPLLRKREPSRAVRRARLVVKITLIAAAAFVLLVAGFIGWWMVTCSIDPSNINCRFG